MEASLMASRKKMKIKKKESRMSFELSLSHGALKTNALTSDFSPSANPKFLAFFQFYKSSLVVSVLEYRGGGKTDEKNVLH